MTQVPYQPHPGDVVRLKSGGPKMTVLREVAVREGVGTVWECSWFVEAKDIHNGEFPALAIERVD
jgi:uncharacterized protein YodC (DUF2158 family)